MRGNRAGWFMRFLSRAVMQRKGRVAVASLSVTIAVGIMVSAICISLGIRQKLGTELKAYGANVIVSPREGFLRIDKGLLSALSPQRGVEHFRMQLYSSVEVAPTATGGATGMASSPSGSVELMGMELAKAGSLRILGTLPDADDEMLVGATLREAMGLGGGEVLMVDFGSGGIPLRVTGFVETGGPEDGAVIMELARAGELTGLRARASAVLVRADTAAMEQTVAGLRQALPQAQVKTLSQVARAEEEFLRKIELLMALVSFVVLVASGISVSSTMSATVLERLKEIGLMKAMGGTRRNIGAFFMAEGISIGMAGGLMGFVLGVLWAQAVSRGAFGSFIPVPLYMLPGALIAGALIAAAASIWPLLGALRHRPSIILRGE